MISFIDDMELGSPVRVGEGGNVIGAICARWRHKWGVQGNDIDYHPHTVNQTKPTKLCLKAMEKQNKKNRRYHHKLIRVDSCVNCQLRKCIYG